MLKKFNKENGCIFYSERFNGQVVSIITDTGKIPQIEAGAMAGIISKHFTGNLVLGFSMAVLPTPVNYKISFVHSLS